MTLKIDYGIAEIWCIEPIRDSMTHLSFIVINFFLYELQTEH